MVSIGPPLEDEIFAQFDFVFRPAAGRTKHLDSSYEFVFVARWWRYSIEEHDSIFFSRDLHSLLPQIPDEL